MITKKIGMIGASLALATLLTWTDSASAQRRGSGGSRGGSGAHSSGNGGSWNGGSRSWNGGSWNGGWNNGYGYRNDGWRGNNWGGFGWGLGLGYGLGSGFGYVYGRPGYWGDYGYYNSFGPGVWANSYDYPGYYNYYGDDGYASEGTYYAPSSTYSAYPSADVGYDSEYSQAPAQDQSSNRAFVTVRVPASDAKVWVEGQEMKDSGAIREYRTPALEDGHNYSYEVRAQWNENGKNREQTRNFKVHPGDHIMVVFGNRENRRRDNDRGVERLDTDRQDRIDRDRPDRDRGRDRTGDIDRSGREGSKEALPREDR